MSGGGDDVRVPANLEREVAFLRQRVAELETALRKAVVERDSALETLRRVVSRTSPAADDEADWGPTTRKVGKCPYCDGHGVLWVHDFRMACRHCNGTGLAVEGD